MALLSQDMTDAEEQRLIVFWRTLPVWRKMEMIGELYETANVLALADLRRRYPDETPVELTDRLIARRKRLEQRDAS